MNEVDDLLDYWAAHPPLRAMVQAYLEIEPASSSLSSSSGNTSQNYATDDDIDNFIGMLG